MALFGTPTIDALEKRQGDGTISQALVSELSNPFNSTTVSFDLFESSIVTDSV